MSDQVIARIWIISKDAGQVHDSVGLSFGPSSVTSVYPSGDEISFPYEGVSGIEVTLPHTKHVHPYWMSCQHMVKARDIPDSHVGSQIAWHLAMANRLTARKNEKFDGLDIDKACERK